MRPPARRFPKVAADGTFVVRVVFASAPGAPIDEVRGWLAAWIRGHSDAFGTSRPFAAYFNAPPEVEPGAAGELILRLHGLGDEGEKRFWKDWYVRIVYELLAVFPEAGEVIRVESVEAA